MDRFILALLFGVMIGLLLGLVGGGGSILTVPILVYVLGHGVHEATATSLAIVGLTALVGVAPHARAGRVAPTTALLFGGAGIGGAFGGAALNTRASGPLILLLFFAGGFVGATVGGSLAGSVDERQLSRGFAALVAVVGLYLVVQNGVTLA